MKDWLCSINLYYLYTNIKGGQQVVIKVQHSDVAEKILQDLKNLETIGTVTYKMCIIISLLHLCSNERKMKYKWIFHDIHIQEMLYQNVNFVLIF